MKIVRLDTGVSWEDTTVAEEDADDLDVAIAELEQLKKTATKAQQQYKDLETKVITMLDEREEKTHISPFNGGWQATKVVGERVKIHEDKLFERLDEKVIDHITTRRFDKAKLESAVSLGIVDPNIVAECATVEQNAPYLRLTRHRDEEPEGPTST